MARNEILRARRQSARSRLVFDQDLAEELADRCQALEPELERRRAALRTCLKKLPDPSRRIIDLRYAESLPVDAIAARLGRTAGSVHVILSRIRALAQCTQRAYNRLLHVPQGVAE